MRDALGSGTILGYCTNVHAAQDLDAVCACLRDHAAHVRARVSPDAPLGVGLWLAAPVVRELSDERALGTLRECIEANGLMAYTLNGFPYGNFHDTCVKHQVYRPDWTAPERYQYTLDLATILHALLPEGAEGSISTLPLGWAASLDDDARRCAADRLVELAQALEHFETTTGRLVHVDLEPEPGCALADSRDMVRFFTENLLGHGADEAVRRHLRVCHDVCHAAVMFEDQATVLERYAAYGMSVGKIQLSSAVRVEFGVDHDGREERQRKLAALETFVEGRYLHQTVVRCPDGDRFHEDLSVALAEETGAEPAEWRVHFHVPVHLEHAGGLTTTREDVVKCLEVARDLHDVAHFEVETYAWHVLPAEVRGASLADDIAAELDWVREVKA